MRSDALSEEHKTVIKDLYDRTRAKLVGYLIARNMDEHSAIDLYHYAIMVTTEKLIKHGEDYFQSGIDAYTFSVLKYKFWKEKKDARVVLQDIEAPLISNEIEDFEKFDEQNAQDDLNGFLRQNLRKLDQRSQEILRKFYYQGQSLHEIALSMGYSSEDVVKSTKHRIIKKLRELMKES